MVCYGEIVDGFPVLRNDIPVTYGFCSSRNILCENNKTLYIERKVGRDYELPIYTWQCSSENTITISEENPTGAVRKLLSATKSIGKKKWKNVSSHFKGNACKKQQYKSSSSNNFKQQGNTVPVEYYKKHLQFINRMLEKLANWLKDIKNDVIWSYMKQ